jgi:hypothetical protein
VYQVDTLGKKDTALEMPDKQWEIPLQSGMRLLIDRRAVAGKVVGFRVVLLAQIDGKTRCLTRYDTAHGYAHQDILDENEKPLAKLLLATEDLNEALHHAIHDLKTNSERYFATFGKKG